MTTQHFTTTIQSINNSLTIFLPFDPNAVWGSKARHYVRGAINGHALRALLSSDGAGYFLSLGAAWLRDNGLAAGITVEVELFPEGPQMDNLAADVAAALESAPDARQFFENLATFYRKNYIRWIESAKKPETRAQRISQMVALLKAGKREK